ncbi:hypothetical protein E4U58_006883 [Claviceps cyperi]|nr:hypothetical protein E4U58_006883 [Claviceps cyperi]
MRDDEASPINDKDAFIDDANHGGFFTLIIKLPDWNNVLPWNPPEWTPIKGYPYRSATRQIPLAYNTCFAVDEVLSRQGPFIRNRVVMELGKLDAISDSSEAMT